MDREEYKLAILKEMQRPCYDDGKKFTNTEKLDRINELVGTSYYEARGRLVRLYSKTPFKSIQDDNLIVISTHADFVQNIRKPFVKFSPSDDLMLGTFDNSATNAAALYLMLTNSLPDNVLVAFTGNEEYGMRGAAELDDFLRKKLGLSPFYLTLDVTDIGFGKKQFSIENTDVDRKNPLPLAYRDELVRIAQEVKHHGYLYPRALPDEAHAYAHRGALGCSLCVPTHGNMHSSNGCYMQRSAYLSYVDVLEHITKTFNRPAISNLRNI